MIEMIVTFCIVLVELPPHKGGKSICNWWKPDIQFKTSEECMANRKRIEEYIVAESWKDHPKAVRIFAKGLCMD